MMSHESAGDVGSRDCRWSAASHRRRARGPSALASSSELVGLITAPQQAEEDRTARRQSRDWQPRGVFQRVAGGLWQ